MPQNKLTDHRSLRLSVCKAAVFFAPFEFIRPFGVLLTISDMLFMAAFIMLAASGRIPRHPYGAMSSIFFTLFGILILGIVISSIANGDPGRAMVFVTQYAFAYLVLAYIVTAEDYSTVVTLVRWYVAGIAIGLAITFYWLWYEPTPNLFVSGNGRLVGIKGAANGQAAVIAATMPLLYFLWVRKQWPLPLLISALLILLYGLIATSSNSGLLATVTGTFVFFIMTITLRRAVKVTCIMLVVVPLFAKYGLDYLPQIFHDRVLSAFESGDLEQAGTFSGRVALIVEALDIIDDTIFIGLGADQFREHSLSGHPVHNAYLLLWTEGGLISMVVWVGMIMTIMMLGLMILRTGKGRIEGAATMATSATILVIANSSTHLFSRSSVLPLILALGLAVATQKMLFQSRERGPSRRAQALPRRSLLSERNLGGR